VRHGRAYESGRHMQADSSLALLSIRLAGTLVHEPPLQCAALDVGHCSCCCEQPSLEYTPSEVERRDCGHGEVHLLQI
jgi:hypothetical protein